MGGGSNATRSLRRPRRLPYRKSLRLPFWKVILPHDTPTSPWSLLSRLSMARPISAAV